MPNHVGMMLGPEFRVFEPHFQKIMQSKQGQFCNEHLITPTSSQQFHLPFFFLVILHISICKIIDGEKEGSSSNCSSNHAEETEEPKISVSLHDLDLDTHQTLESDH